MTAPAECERVNPPLRTQLIAGIRSIDDGIARTYGMPEDTIPFGAKVSTLSVLELMARGASK